MKNRLQLVDETQPNARQREVTRLVSLGWDPRQAALSVYGTALRRVGAMLSYADDGYRAHDANGVAFAREPVQTTHAVALEALYLAAWREQRARARREQEQP